MTQHFLLFGITLTIISCQTSEKKSGQEQFAQHQELLITNDIDTARTISQLAIKENGARLDLLNEIIDNLSEFQDTLELKYYFSLIEGERWIDFKKSDKTLNCFPNRSESETLDKYGYYIEAAHKNIEIDERVMLDGTTICFIGGEYKAKRFPKDGEFPLPYSGEKVKIFRYYSYKILRPFKIFTDDKFIKLDDATGDTIKEPDILTVK